MALNALSLLKHAFGSLKTPVGQKVAGLFFLVQALNIGGSLLMEAGTGTMVGLSVVISLAAALIGIIATIGGLRAFREGELSRDSFTQNLAWPFGRIVGANLTTTIFAYGVGALLVIPVGALMALVTGATSVEAVTGAGAVAVLLGALALLLGLGGFFYVVVTLILAQPLVAIDDRRMFQALDESIQRTKGHRSSIFVALLGIAIAYIGLYGLFAGLGVLGPDFIAALGILLVSPLLTSASLSLLNYLTEELPEA